MKTEPGNHQGGALARPGCTGHYVRLLRWHPGGVGGSFAGYQLLSVSSAFALLAPVAGAGKASLIISLTTGLDLVVCTWQQQADMLY